VRNAKPSGKTKFYKHEIRNPLQNGIVPNFETFPTAEWKIFGKIFLNIPLLTIGKKFWFSKMNIKLGEIAKVQRGSLPAKNEQLSNKKTQHFNLRWFNGQVFRYNIEWETEKQYVCYSELNENKPLHLFQTKRILGRQLLSRQFRMNFTYTEEEFAFKQSLYAIYDLDKKFDYFYVLGILNSQLFSFMQVNFNASLQRDDYPKFALTDYKEFPIPNISLAEQKPIIDLVKHRLKNETVDNKNVDNKIDTLVYKLYNITPKEQSIINETTKLNNQ
jgi:hypothetical protein